MKNLKIHYLFLLALTSGNTYTCFKGLNTFCEYIAGCYCCYDQELWQAQQNGKTKKQEAIAKENAIVNRQIDSYLRLQQATAEKNKQNQTINNNMQHKDFTKTTMHAISCTSPTLAISSEDVAESSFANVVPNAFPNTHDESKSTVLTRYNMNNQLNNNPNLDQRVAEYSILNQSVNHFNQTDSQTGNFCLHSSKSNTPNTSNRGLAYNSNNHNDQRLFVRQHSNHNENSEHRSDSTNNNTLNNSPMCSRYPTQNIQTAPYPDASYIINSIMPHFNNEQAIN